MKQLGFFNEYIQSYQVAIVFFAMISILTAIYKNIAEKDKYSQEH